MYLFWEIIHNLVNCFKCKWTPIDLRKFDVYFDIFDSDKTEKGMQIKFNF